MKRLTWAICALVICIVYTVFHKVVEGEAGKTASDGIDEKTLCALAMFAIMLGIIFVAAVTG